MLQLALIAALILVVALSVRTNALRRDLRQATYELQMPQVGDLVPPFSTVTLRGESVVVAAPAGPMRQVLFAFNTRCALCRSSVPEWNALDSTIRARALPVAALGLSLDSLSATRQYTTEHGVRYAVACLPERIRRLYRIPGVPLTMVTDSSGELLYVRPGVVTRLVRDSVLALLGG